jgi:Ras-related C3 botulinum toxin substrate 1
MDYVPTVFDNYNTRVLVDGKQVTVGLWDTAGQEDYDRLRPLAYPSTDVFVLCFLLNDRTTFKNVKVKWYPELQEHAPGVPIVLAGLGLNEWEGDRGVDIVAEAEGEALKELIKVNLFRCGSVDFGPPNSVLFLQAISYIECSARTQDNLKYLFDEAIRAGLQAPSIPQVVEIDLRDEEVESPMVVPGMGDGCCTIS